MMNSSNELRKFYYNKNQDSVVPLKQFILFTENNQKYVLLKLFNSLDRKLKKIIFCIYEYDKDHNLIEKKSITEDNISINSQSLFNLNSKIILNSECESIEYILEYALFDTVEYREGEYFKVEKGLSNYSSTKPAKKIPENKIRNIPIERKLRRQGFVIETKPRKYKLGIVNLFVFLFAVLALTLTGLGIWDSARKSSILTEVYLNYQIDYEIKGKNVSVKHFEGDCENLIIPNQIKKHNVTEIQPNAFVNSRFKTVQFMSDRIDIKRGAFVNCDRLEIVLSEKKVGSIEPYAFYMCDRIKTVYLPNTEHVGSHAFGNARTLRDINVENAIVDDEAFADILYLDRLAYDRSYTGSLETVFNPEGIVKIKNLITKEAYISYDFFNRFNIYNLYLNNPLVHVDEGALFNVTNVFYPKEK